MRGLPSARGRPGAIGTLVAISVCAVVAACGGTARRPTLGAPQLLSLSYGEYRPRGAPATYLGLKLTAVEAGGEILETGFDAYGGAGATGDSECALGGRRRGQLETFYTPINLPPGPQTVQITAVGSTCGSNRRTRSATRTFHIYVPRADAPSREPLQAGSVKQAPI